jgi:hypothetical protein
VAIIKVELSFVFIFLILKREPAHSQLTLPCRLTVYLRRHRESFARTSITNARP